MPPAAPQFVGAQSMSKCPRPDHRLPTAPEAPWFVSWRSFQKASQPAHILVELHSFGEHPLIGSLEAAEGFDEWHSRSACCGADSFRRH